MYGREDLSQFPVFQGGFINFGYWDEVPKSPTKEQRIHASRRLYEKILDRLSIGPQDKILEVGCGLGLGCLMALDEYRAKEVWGLDGTTEQIERCQKNHAARLKEGRLHFVEGFASKIPLEDQTISKVYSIEAAQHFSSLPPFFKEAFRVLQPGGKFIFTTFFREKGASLEEIGEWLQTVGVKVDFFHPIHTSVTQMKKAGFEHVAHHNIGKRVWEGFEKWHAIAAPDDWGRNFFKIYQKGLVDYYVIEGTKPS